ncbi:hypothetical protein MYSTI_07833 [Myxococcus stipitatus DSM 14675]|uniref:Lipoprotein n=1 Tax=Myxococcus stipitatus (strain DSM 14675 / JCM 12634 / Mx s8) TaxID=1278073 RepID=L7UMJ5_MYXSD|nr:hypothetical protein [Myxococcus stipitatus]AGC49105.1 hypothetical protein MYSTI_07833 [Myxococcus stipitatus DSM 14675]
MKRMGWAILLSTFFAVGCGGPTADGASTVQAPSSPQALLDNGDVETCSDNSEECNHPICRCRRKCLSECGGVSECYTNCKANCTF